MKKITKLTGIIVFAALIGLSMSACDDLSGDKAKDGDSIDGGNGGATFTSVQAFLQQNPRCGICYKNRNIAVIGLNLANTTGGKSDINPV